MLPRPTFFTVNQSILFTWQTFKISIQADKKVTTPALLNLLFTVMNPETKIFYCGRPLSNIYSFNPTIPLSARW